MLTATGGQTLQAPTIDGLTAVSVQNRNGTIVALFHVTAADLYRLHVTGQAGGFTLALSIAGDVNLDGVVNGVDSGLEIASAPSADIDGDGKVNAIDAELIAADYGVTASLPPQIEATLPSFTTHVGLRMMIDLTGIATDPSGDPITYRVVGDQHATATISADGTSLLFSPDDGYTGEATFTLVADDGFAQSAQATIDVEVSSAPLMHIDFDQSRILFSARRRHRPDPRLCRLRRPDRRAGAARLRQRTH